MGIWGYEDMGIWGYEDMGICVNRKILITADNYRKNADLTNFNCTQIVL